MTTPAPETGSLPPPFISSARGLANIRDIGGYPIISHGITVASVRKGIVFRGPDPSPVSPESLSILTNLGITTSFDIRSQQQIDRAGGYKDLDGINRIWCPVFGEEEYTPEKAAIRYMQYSSMDVQDTVDAFTDILVAGGPIAFRRILLHLASFSSLPPSTLPPAFLMHCTTGNNRTGVFVGVLLKLLGVERNVIADEYALSEIGLAPSRPAALGRLMKNAVFAGEGGRERCERMLGARRESMLAMLEAIDRKWGGVEGYVKKVCELTEEEIGEVMRVMTANEII